jgi:CheY-like chemotaxis protein
VKALIVFTVSWHPWRQFEAAQMKTDNAPTILIAEDDDDDFFLLSRALRKTLGKTPPLYRARDGVETIEYLAGKDGYSDRRRHPFPGLVVLDLKMPRKDGFDVLQWIRKQKDFQFLFVIVLSSSSEPEDIERAYGMGANSYLAKPANFDFYEEMTRSLIRYWLDWNQVPDEVQ